jgi:dephospho-CoA kinase
MGKSTTAAMFAEEGLPVWDADAAVRILYDKGGAAALEILKHYPTVIEDGAVSRPKLKALIAADPDVLDQVQSLVHPLVANHRAAFLKDTTAPIVLLDIPLLYEIGADQSCNAVAVVSVAPNIQKDRVMARGEMTEAEFEMIVSRQMPDADKRERARWVIDTSTLDGARAAVANILSDIRQELEDA